MSVDQLSQGRKEEMAEVSNTAKTPQGPIQAADGPRPYHCTPTLLAAQALPLLGHMHPPFIHIMDEIKEGLRYMFQTESPYTLMISGTGHAGMEAAVANLLEPGEKIIVGVNGIWGERVADLAGRYQGDVVQLKADAGKTFSVAELKAAVAQHKPAILFLVQGESSTGTHQALGDGLGEACRAAGTLLVVDTVASLGGVPLFADKWGVDAIYSGSQKCLSGPPGAAPFFMSQRAVDKLKGRKTKPATYNLDLNLIADYWGWFKPQRSYHHTGVVSTFYAMREALAIVGEEGLQAMWARHLAAHQLLWEGLGELGLEPYVADPKDRLVTVNTIKVPEGVDWAALSKDAMDTYAVEIAGGLGPSLGKVWRVGVMGFNARPMAVEQVLVAFRRGLVKQGWKQPAAAGKSEL
ncbi:pyridoxal phosphate-dependent transferase [Scenedesmus sp. NREL 46B-D3]|nr:pyridoxal phosphate-dependent transferase [Scenedesmus sp. NREL 46B-D3]